MTGNCITLILCFFVFSCDYVAIGNGVGCRDAETFISQLIKQRVFAPQDIAYW